MKILLVEDEGILRFFLKNFLKKSNHQIELIEAFDGAEGLKKFKSEDDISIIITDIKMPNMNGISLIEKVREIDPNIPIIIESGLRDEEIDQIRSAVNDVIKKPIEPSDIINLINKYS